MMMKDDEKSFDEAELYFELNDTDGDLGFHGLVDGEGWIQLEIEDSLGRELLDLSLAGPLRVHSCSRSFSSKALSPRLMCSIPRPFSLVFQKV
ncbi:MAG: hypothetical protein GKR94_07270 [Gammaproteobacteria bacterium]|nr:hypothetical protein [Gammaproteobacteria bacterium]